MTKQSKSGVPKPQWWKHLRDWKRVFWKKDRQEGKRQANDPKDA